MLFAQVRVLCKIVQCCWQKYVIFEGVHVDVCKCVLLLAVLCGWAGMYVIGRSMCFGLQEWVLMDLVCVVLG